MEDSELKERIISVKLTDEDCEKVINTCGYHGVTVSQLIEYFLNDLVCGTYTNGSDERDLANRWLDRCSANFTSHDCLLYSLFSDGIDIDRFVEAWDKYKEYNTTPSLYADAIADLCEGENLWFIDTVNECTENWIKNNPNCDIDIEVEKVKQWLHKADEFIND